MPVEAAIPGNTVNKYKKQGGNNFAVPAARFSRLMNGKQNPIMI